MNERRQRQLLAHHTGLAKKVWEFVPINEAWTAAQINSSMRAAGQTTADHRAVRACIGDMKDQGLIREITTGLFIRTAVTKSTQLEIAEVTAELIPKKEVLSMPPKTAVVSKASIPAPVTPDSLSVLADIASDLGNLGDYVSGRVKELTARIEEAALMVEMERESSKGAVEKLKALQGIFQSISDS